MEAIRVRGLRYRYPGGTEDVLHGLDFEVAPGEVFGFLGPNGSGKSTTQQVLTRLLPGYSGDASVLGADVRRARDTFYNRIGVCFEFPNLYEKLTAEENLEFYRRFFAGPTEEPRELLDALDLPVGDRRRIGEFSRGMKMRVVLARSLINRPELLFLDEPTANQDPEHAVLVRRLIRERADNGTTVFLTTHNMVVADELCDRVAFLVGGRIERVDTPSALKRQYAERRARVEFAEGETVKAAEFELDAPAGKRALVECIESHHVVSIHSLEPTLEDVFLRVTGRDLS